MPFDLNLLPPSRLAALLRQEAVLGIHRFLVSITMGLVLLTLVGLVSRGILQHLIRTISHEQEAQLEQAISQYGVLRESLTADNAFLSAVSGLVHSRQQWGEKVYDLLAVVPGGIRINAVRGQSGKKPSISISGQAATRNALTILEQRLKTIPWAKSVDAPNSNLIDRTNAPYEFILPLQ